MKDKLKKKKDGFEYYNNQLKSCRRNHSINLFNNQVQTAVTLNPLVYMYTRDLFWRGWSLLCFGLSGKGSCLQLWYHMYGRGVGELRVYQLSVFGNQTLIFSQSGDQGRLWRFGQATLLPQDQPYRVSTDVTHLKLMRWIYTASLWWTGVLTTHVSCGHVTMSRSCIVLFFCVHVSRNPKNVTRLYTDYICAHQQTFSSNYRQEHATFICVLFLSNTLKALLL